MDRTLFLYWIVLATSAATAFGADPAPASCPETQPVSTSQPAAAPLDPEVEKILDRLEKKQIQDIQADLVYSRLDPVIDSEERFTGILLFRHEEPNPRFLIRFDKMTLDGIPRKRDGEYLKEWHVFDGQWYIEAREQTKRIVKREIVRPGERFEAFRIGKGPFPMPFGQKKTEIAGQFVIKLVGAKPEDPKNADHLECIPLPGTDLGRRYGKVDFYVDRTSDLPVCIRTVEKEEEREITARFTNVKLNKGLAASRLNLPDLPGYDMTSEPLPPLPPPPQVLEENQQ